jgi:hypothetical protein
MKRTKDGNKKLKEVYILVSKIENKKSEKTSKRFLSKISR